MENKNLEIIKFTQKAIGYKTAIKKAPFSRILEIIPILNVLNSYIDEHELDKRKVAIVDLMAGNGYLTNFLLHSGYRNIHAIEACNEMSYESEYYESKYVKLHPLPNIESVVPILQNINPYIIVSLASFHHLIKHDEQGKVDSQRSLSLQEKIIYDCMKTLHRNGIFLIVDIYENELIKSQIGERIEYWKTSKIKKILSDELLDKKLIRRIQKSRNIDTYNVIVTEYLSKKNIEENPSLRWFREVVNTNTSIGHDDKAISKKLLENIINSYTLSMKLYSCPWIFNNQNQLRDFIIHKFGFIYDEQKKIKDANLFKKAEDVVGISHPKNSLVTFSWSLALIGIRHKERYKVVRHRRRLVIELVILNLVLITDIVLRKMLPINLKDFLILSNSTVFIFVGVVIKEFFDLFVRRK